uniref:B box-type domain-containing protein n=1 Tax=Maylandia zebra TaxID=106582 RepID=A0A3P9BS44_9CICH
MCLVSYCQTHLEPHQRISALKKHKLIDPVQDLESRICRDHGEPLELICRLDQRFLCRSCKCSDHKTHETVSLEDEAEMRKSQLRLENNSMDQMIQEREQKIQELQQSVKTSRSKAEEALSYSRKVMTALVQHIKTEFTRLSEAIETKRRNRVKSKCNKDSLPLVLLLKFPRVNFCNPLNLSLLQSLFCECQFDIPQRCSDSSILSPSHLLQFLDLLCVSFLLHLPNQEVQVDSSGC